MHRWTAFTLCLAACAHGRAPAPPALRLDRVVLFQNGIGHFERRGGLADRHLRLVLRPHEVDDVIKTLTVIDRDGKAQQVTLSEQGSWRNNWIVTQGVAPGEQVILDGLNDLRAGTEVVTVPVTIDAEGVVREVVEG